MPIILFTKFSETVRRTFNPEGLLSMRWSPRRRHARTYRAHSELAAFVKLTIPLKI
jgi:hypothetical protein